jgi:tRNA-splicing ligase RtcB (3'-phosphate/5'-hydroxy nucleic acid ligase)
MSKAKIGNSDLKLLGITEIGMLKMFGRFAKKLNIYRKLSKPGILDLYKQLLANPDLFLDAENELSQLASELIEIKNKDKVVKTTGSEIELLPRPIDYQIFGREHIEVDALKQMQTAMQLPVAEAGALMPDAHSGYGLPIGGVLATKSNVVIPYAVGVDIACRMCMTVFDIPAKELISQSGKLKESLYEFTVFGVGSKCRDHLDNRIFDLSDWNETKLIRQFRDLAFSQLGTSGAGNHFVEWGILQVDEFTSEVNLSEGNYLALLSHSGSRGFGSEIASFYSKIAMQKTRLPQGAKHLAWLDLESEEGQEYWTAMTLAGKYASANHHEIHGKIAKNLGYKVLKKFENHHNFAWKEKLPDGKQVVVHRKGATPAGSNDIGIIPGSMTLPGYVIKGKGNPVSLNSASHGAGRIMSRNQAFKSFTRDDLVRQLNKYGVDLIGGDIDEAPMVYKNIETVMKEQENLVYKIAKFFPKIVRMADPDRRNRR